METKRCAYCHKLSRADAQTCRRCGHAFSERRPSRPARQRGAGTSIPPASTHRVGHYSGLHPEDQPYQSTLMEAQRPVSSTSTQRRVVRGEPEGIILPTTSRTRGTTRKAETEPLRLRQQAHQQARQLVQTPLPEQKTVLITPAFPSPPQQRERRRYFVPIGLTLSCIFLLVAGSLLAWIFIAHHTLGNQRLQLSLDHVRAHDRVILTGIAFGANSPIALTMDDTGTPLLDGSGKALVAHTDGTGHFSASIIVPESWHPGQHTIHANDDVHGIGATALLTVLPPSTLPPLLKLTSEKIDMGGAPAGAITPKTLTLINAGGGQATWQASSDQAWLTVNPNSGTVSGEETVTISVNRGTLAPASYSGNVLFLQQKSKTTLKLIVTMTVSGGSTALAVSTSSLTYSATTTQNPASQSITLQNTSSGQPLDWSATTTTADGNNWLAISPTSGQLAPNTSATVTVSVQVAQLSIGSYQGTINFKGGANPQVTVTLNIQAPGNLVVSPPALNFTATGQSPADQTVTLQNSGGEAIDWSGSATTADGAAWLTLLPVSGHIEANTSTSVTVHIKADGLAPHSYQGMLTFTAVGQSKQLPVSLTISLPPAPVISVKPASLNFSTVKGTNAAAQSFTLTNTGNATLHWTISEDHNGATFFPVTPTTGSLTPAASTQITVNPALQSALAGPLTAQITVQDSDTGTTVKSQALAVNATIKDQPELQLSDSELDFSNSSVATDTTQLLVISNPGSQPLNWSIQVQGAGNPASWLSVDVDRASIVSGGEMVLNVTCHSIGLAPGVYTATLRVSDTDASTPVAPQTVAVVLTVS